MGEIDFFTMEFNKELPDNIIEGASEFPDIETVVLKDKSFYKDFEKVQQRFTDSSGEFDEKQFDEFYDQSLSKYHQFKSAGKAIKDFRGPFIDSVTNRNIGLTNLVKPNTFSTSAKYNDIYGRNIGLTQTGKMSKPVRSIYEVAQQSKVRDSKGNILEETAEEKGFWGNLFDPMVLATHDIDGVDDKGRKFKKGDVKLDSEGKPYYELLGDRDGINKQHLSSWDVITKESSWINEYDFMDSDDLEKSIIGTIAKTAVQVVPYFIPYVNAVYIGAQVGGNIISGGGTLIKSGMELAYGDDLDKNNSLLKGIDGFQSRWDTLTPGLTMESKESLFTFENLGNLAAQSVGQLYGQRYIAKIPQLLKFGKATETASKALGATYMAATSAQDLYAGAKKIGASDRESAALYLGLFGALSTFFYKSPVGNWVLKNLDEANMIQKQSIKKILPQAQQIVQEATDQTTKIAKLTQLGKSMGKLSEKAWSKTNPPQAIIAGSTLEAIEEGTELFMQKGFEGIYNGLKSLGFGDEKSLKSRFKQDNFGQELTASLIGGFLGGAIFKGHDIVMGHNPQMRELSDLILSGQGKDLVSVVKDMQKKGELGDTTLSTSVNEKGDFEVARENEKTQNDFVADRLISYINSFEQLIQSKDIPLKSDLIATYNQKFGKEGARGALLVDANFNTTLRDDLTDIFTSLKDNQERLRQITTDLDTDIDTKEIKQLKTEQNEILTQIDKLKNGQMSNDYYSQGLFMLNDAIHSKYGIKSFSDFLDVDTSNKLKFEKASLMLQAQQAESEGKPVASFSKRIEEIDSEISELGNKAFSEYTEYKAGNFKNDFRTGFAEFQKDLKNNSIINKLKNSNVDNIAKDLNFSLGERGYLNEQSQIEFEDSIEKIETFLKGDSLDLGLSKSSNGEPTLSINGEKFTIQEFKNFIENVGSVDATLAQELTEKFNQEISKFFLEEFSTSGGKSKILDDKNFLLQDDTKEILRSGTIEDLASHLSDYEVGNDETGYGVDFDFIDDAEGLEEVLKQKQVTFNALQELIKFSDISSNSDFKITDVNSIINEIFTEQTIFINEQLQSIKDTGSAMYFEPQESFSKHLKSIQDFRRAILAHRDITPYVNKFAGNKNLLEVKNDLYQVLYNTSSLIENRLDYLKDLSELNSKDLLRGMLNSDKKLIGLQGKAIVGMADAIPEFKSFLTSADVEESFNSLTGIVVSDNRGIEFGEAFNHLVNVEAKVYDFYQQNPELVNKYLKKAFPSKEAFAKYKVVSDADSNLPKVIEFNYLNTIIRANSKEFYKGYKAFVEINQIAPIYNQELIIKQLHSFIEGGKDISLIEGLNKKIAAGRIPNAIPLTPISNIAFGQSTFGAGKTSVIIPMLIDLYRNKHDMRVAVSAPFARQLTNLERELGKRNGVGVRGLDEIISFLYGDFDSSVLETVLEDKDLNSAVDQKKIEEEIRNLVRTKESSIREMINSNKDISTLGLIVVDEITQFNKNYSIFLDELIEIHNKVRKESNIGPLRAVAMGDPDQTGYIHEGEPYNIENFTYVESSIVSQVSLRGTYEPFRNLNAQLKVLTNESYDKGSDFNFDTLGIKIRTELYNNAGFQKISSLEEIVDKIQNISEKTNAVIVGSDSAKNRMETGIISKSSKLLVISDDKDVKLPIPPHRYEVVTPNEAQGSEANVVLLLAKPDEGLSDREKFNFYNTHLSRALLYNFFVGDDRIFEDTKLVDQDAVIHNRFRDESGALNKTLLKEFYDSKLSALSQIQADKIVDKDKRKSRLTIVDKEKMNEKMDEVRNKILQTDEDKKKQAEENSFDLVEETTFDAEEQATYKGEVIETGSDDIRLYSFYVPQNEVTQLKGILPTRDEASLRALSHKAKAALMGLRDVPNELKKVYKFSEKKMTLVGRPFTSSDVNIVPTSDAEFMHREGEPFLYYEVEVPSRLSGKESLKLTMLTFPRLSNPVRNTTEPRTIKQVLLHLGLTPVVNTIESLESEVEAKGSINLEVPQEDIDILLKKESIQNGKVIYDQRVEFQDFISDNNHLSIASFIYTGSKESVISEDKMNMIGRPLIVWSYKDMSKEELLRAYATDSDDVGVIVAGSQKIEFNELMERFADFKDLNSLLSPKSKDVLNTLLYDLSTKEFNENLAIRSSEQKAIKFAKQLSASGLIKDPVLKDDVDSVELYYTPPNTDQKYIKDLDLVEILSPFTKGVDSDLIVGYNLDEKGNLIDGLNFVNDSKEIVGYIENIVNQSAQAGEALFTNIVVDDSISTAKGASTIAGIANPEDIFLTTKYISPSEVVVKVSDLTQLKEYNRELDAQRVLEMKQMSEIQRVKNYQIPSEIKENAINILSTFANVKSIEETFLGVIDGLVYSLEYNEELDAILIKSDTTQQVNEIETLDDLESKIEDINKRREAEFTNIQISISESGEQGVSEAEKESLRQQQQSLLPQDSDMDYEEYLEIEKEVKNSDEWKRLETLIEGEDSKISEINKKYDSAIIELSETGYTQFLDEDGEVVEVVVKEVTTTLNENTGEITTEASRTSTSEYDTWVETIRGLEGSDAFIDYLQAEDFTPNKDFEIRLLDMMLNNPNDIETIEKIIDHNCKE